MSRSSRPQRVVDIWPGFVDGLTTLLLTIVFVLVVFVLSEFFLARALSGRDEALSRLNHQVAELAELLSLEKQANIQLRGDINQLAAQLQASTAERDDLNGQLAMLLGQQDDLRKQLDAASKGSGQITTEKEDLARQLAAAMAMLEAERVTKRDQRGRAQDVEQELEKERNVSNEALRQVTALNQQIAELRLQLASLQEALDARDTENIAQKVQIANLGQRLNVALAAKVEELSRYRSEFFGRLRQILEGRSQVSIEGDRFVIQSGVLFGSGSAQLGAEGRGQLSELADILLEISAEIPPELKWVLRVDGHTDRVPINRAEFPSNWELSAARAISVAKFLIERGVPADRVAPAGFGEYHPLDPADNEAAYSRNRRIELKLTER